MFGLIEAVLSGGHQVIDSGALIYGRHPHTEGDSQLVSLGLHINFGGLGAQALGNINCGLGIGCWQQPPMTAAPIVDLSNPWNAGVLGAVVASSLFILGGAIFYCYRKKQIAKMDAYSTLMGEAQGGCDGTYNAPMVV